MNPSIGATGTVPSGVVCDSAVRAAAASGGMLSSWLWPWATMKSVAEHHRPDRLAGARRGSLQEHPCARMADGYHRSVLASKDVDDRIDVVAEFNPGPTLARGHTRQRRRLHVVAVHRATG